MSRNALTRIVAEVGGALHPLLSIRENASGSLIMKPKRSKFDIQSGVWRQTIEQKITVHTPSASGNNTVHHTLRTTGAPDVETHLVTSAIKDGGVDMVYSHTFGNLSLGPPSQPVRSKDRSVKVASYRPDHSVLHLLVFIAPPGATEDFVERDPTYDRWRASFADITLILVTAYSYLPSLPDGRLYHEATAPLTIGGIRQGSPMAPSRGLNAKEARAFANTRLLWHHADTFERVAKLFSSEDMGVASESAAKFVPMLMTMLNLGVRRSPYMPSNQAVSEI